jgi:hypothetical protein
LRRVGKYVDCAPPHLPKGAREKLNSVDRDLVSQMNLTFLERDLLHNMTWSKCERAYFGKFISEGLNQEEEERLNCALR